MKNKYSSIVLSLLIVSYAKSAAAPSAPASDSGHAGGGSSSSDTRADIRELQGTLMDKTQAIIGECKAPKFKTGGNNSGDLTAAIKRPLYDALLAYIEKNKDNPSAAEEPYEVETYQEFFAKKVAGLPYSEAKNIPALKNFIDAVSTYYSEGFKSAKELLKTYSNPEKNLSDALSSAPKGKGSKSVLSSLDLLNVIDGGPSSSPTKAIAIERTEKELFAWLNQQCVANADGQTSTAYKPADAEEIKKIAEAADKSSSSPSSSSQSSIKNEDAKKALDEHAAAISASKSDAEKIKANEAAVEKLKKIQSTDPKEKAEIAKKIKALEQENLTMVAAQSVPKPVLINADDPANYDPTKGYDEERARIEKENQAKQAEHDKALAGLVSSKPIETIKAKDLPALESESKSIKTKLAEAEAALKAHTKGLPKSSSDITAEQAQKTSDLKKEIERWKTVQGENLARQTRAKESDEFEKQKALHARFPSLFPSDMQPSLSLAQSGRLLSEAQDAFNQTLGAQGLSEEFKQQLKNNQLPARDLTKEEKLAFDAHKRLQQARALSSQAEKLKSATDEARKVAQFEDMLKPDSKLKGARDLRTKVDGKKDKNGNQLQDGYRTYNENATALDLIKKNRVAWDTVGGDPVKFGEYLRKATRVRDATTGNVDSSEFEKGQALVAKLYVDMKFNGATVQVLDELPLAHKTEFERILFEMKKPDVTKPMKDRLREQAQDLVTQYLLAK